jgi:hypothetical protein
MESPVPSNFSTPRPAARRAPTKRKRTDDDLDIEEIRHVANSNDIQAARRRLKPEQITDVEQFMNVSSHIMRDI